MGISAWIEPLEGSYGKVLSDALITAIDGQNGDSDMMNGAFMYKLHESMNDALSEFSNEVAGLVLKGVRELLEEKGFAQNMEQLQIVQETPQKEGNEIPEDMLDFAFSMGE
ncbi:MAG: hypothetical protein NC489_29275 [Ruminococcus flavefaciens]|nr:hypothetical protein [Ruminococcus flavefaciens]